MSPEIHGFCEPAFQPLKDAFIANFDLGLELGASLAATHQGRTVVDLWAGWADPEKTRPWQENTIIGIHSTTKVASAISALLAVDRGIMELNEPVARYWPEFAQAGKQSVTVRDAFSHQSGVPGFATQIPFDELYHWDHMTERVAREPHWFDGERRVIYHAFTYGYPLGEIIRRGDGRPLSRFFREEIASPAGIDLQFGLIDKTELTRLAGFIPPDPPPPLPPGSLLEKLFQSVERGGDRFRGWELASAEIPAAVSHGNGRSIAKLGAIMAMGGVLEGVRYLSTEIAEEAGREQAYGQCPYLGWVKFGLGFGLDSKAFPYPTETTYGWGGAGGSNLWIDPATGVSVGYAPNNFSVPKSDEFAGPIDTRVVRLGRALKKILRTI